MILLLYFLAISIIKGSFKIKKYFISQKDYDLTAEKIYNSTGYLSFNELDQKLFGTKINYSKFNNIHIGMSFNNDYYLLTTVTIASLFKNAAPDTYIHVYIIETGDMVHETRKKLLSLKAKINNNTEFIFYNGSRAINDFGPQIIKECYGVGEYARLLSPEIVKSDRVLVIDSGDLFIEKDLVEFFNLPFNDTLILGSLDPYAKCFTEIPSLRKKNYINSGVLLFNAKKWREMEIYKDIVNLYQGFNFYGRLSLPIQDIVNTFLPYVSLGYLPIKYNFQYHSYIYSSCSVISRNEVEDAIKNEIIRHNNKMKPYFGDGEKDKWIHYANLTGFLDEICLKYPKGCYKN